MSGWPLISLGDIFEISRGGSPRPIQRFITDEPDGINWIMIGDASENLKYIYKTKKRIRKSGATKSRMVYPGDFLLTNSMSFGHPYILKTTGCIHDGWLVLRSQNDNVDQDYFYHLLGSSVVYSEFQKRAAGAVVKNLNIDLVRNVQIPLPPLKEQKRIAAILDKADATLRKRHQAIQLAEEFLRSVFLDMFGDPVLNPKGWKTVSIGENLSFLTSGSRGWAKYYSNEGRLFLRIQNIGSNQLFLDDIAYVNPPDSAEAKRTMVQAGDVLLSITADLGRTAVIPSDLAPAHINQHLAILRFDSIEPIFASAFLASKGGQTQIQKLNREGVKAGLNFENIRTLNIFLPPKYLQKKWSDIYNKNFTQKSLLKQSLRTQTELFNSLTQRAFRGEL